MIDLLFPYKRYSFINESVLESLPENLLELINQKKSVIKLKKGQTLFHEGMMPTGVYILRSGKVKQYALGLNGKQHIFYLVKENEILGYHNLLCDENYSHSSSCLTDCTFEFIPASLFNFIIEENPTLRNRLLKNLSHEFGVFINNSRILAQHTVRERVAISIVKLERFFNDNSAIKLSRKDHSNFIGTSTESLVRVLHDFKQEGLIEVKENMIVVKEMKELVKCTNYM